MSLTWGRKVHPGGVIFPRMAFFCFASSPAATSLSKTLLPLSLLVFLQPLLLLTLPLLTPRRSPPLRLAVPPEYVDLLREQYTNTQALSPDRSNLLYFLIFAVVFCVGQSLIFTMLYIRGSKVSLNIVWSCVEPGSFSPSSCDSTNGVGGNGVRSSRRRDSAACPVVDDLSYVRILANGLHRSTTAGLSALNHEDRVDTQLACKTAVQRAP